MFALWPLHLSCSAGIDLSSSRTANLEEIGGGAESKTGVSRLNVNTLRTGLLNCLNARSRGLTFRHRASCI